MEETISLRTRIGWSHVEMYGEVNADICILILGNCTHTTDTFRNLVSKYTEESFRRPICFITYDYIHINSTVHGLEGYAMQLEDILCDIGISASQVHAICVGFGVGVMMKYARSPRKYTINKIACFYPNPTQYLPNESSLFCCCPNVRKGWQLDSVTMEPTLVHNVRIEVLERWYQFSKDVRDGEWFVIEDPRHSKIGLASAEYMKVDYRPIMSVCSKRTVCEDFIYSDVIFILVSTLII